MGETEQKCQLAVPGIGGRRRCVRRYALRLQPGLGYHLVELVVAQIAGNRHRFDARFAAQQSQRGLIKAQIQRQRRAIASFLQRVGLHQRIGQHGDFVARHIDGGEPAAAQAVDVAIGCDRQRRRCNMDAQHHRAAAQALDRERVVDLGGGRVVDRKSTHLGARQRLADGHGLHRREAQTLREVLQHKALPMKLVGRVDRAAAQQQVQGRGFAVTRGLHHGLVLGRVFVGLKKNFVELLAHRLGALAGAQVLGPLGDLGGLLLFLFDGSQRLGHDFGGGFAKLALARAAKVVRRFEQAHQHGRLFLQTGFVAEIVARQFGKAKVALGGEFPGQVQFYRLAERLRGGHKRAGGGAFKAQ